MTYGPGGAVGVVLDSRYESFMVATKAPDGKLATDVRHGRPQRGRRRRGRREGSREDRDDR